MFRSNKGVAVDLSGRTIVVTGGSRGIGAATVRLLAQHGAAVALIARDPDALPETLRPDVSVFTADVTDEVAMVAAFAAIEARFGRIDGLFANAGVGLAEGPVHELSGADWDLVMTTNVRGVYVALRETLRRMVAAGQGGSIVCTGSCVVGAAVPGVGAAYHASKGAVEAMARNIAVDYGQYGIRCNALSPGATETELMWTSVPEHEIQAARAEVAGCAPLGRVAEPEDIARAALWLLSDEAAYVTGATLAVDGGVNALSVLPA
jgi:NAD(P)-dependent dehydrogenase (short-subunit alcohol dehydrogenase family)